jgi:hypothetical protein
MWTTAEKQLRANPQKRETMEKYDKILVKGLGDKLEPMETTERQKQAFGFFNKEIEQLNTTDTTRKLEKQLLDPHTP